MAGELYLQGFGNIANTVGNLYAQKGQEDWRWREFEESQKRSALDEAYRQRALAQQAQLQRESEVGAQQRAALGQWGQYQQNQYDQPYRQAQIGQIQAQTADIPQARQQAASQIDLQRQNFNLQRQRLFSDIAQQQAQLQQQVALAQLQQQGADYRTQLSQQGAMDRTMYQNPVQQYFNQQFQGGNPSDEALRYAQAYIPPPTQQRQTPLSTDQLKAQMAKALIDSLRPEDLGTPEGEKKIAEINNLLLGRGGTTSPTQQNVQDALDVLNNPNSTPEQKAWAERVTGRSIPEKGLSWADTQKAIGEGQQLAAAVMSALQQRGATDPYAAFAALNELGANHSPLARFYAESMLRNWGIGGTPNQNQGGFAGSQQGDT